MWILFYITIILVTITMIPINGLSDMFWRPKEFMYILMGFSFVGAGFMVDNKVNIKNKYLSVIFIYSVISFVYTFGVPMLFSKGNAYAVFNYWNLRPTLNLILGLLLIKTLVEKTDCIDRWITMFKVICFVNIFISAYAIFQYFGIEPLYKVTKYALTDKPSMRILTFFGNEFLTANFIAITLPFLYMFKGKIYIIGACLSFVALWLCDGVLSLGAAVLATLIYLALRKKWWLLSIAVLSIIGAVIFVYNTPDFFGFSGRLEVWGRTISLCSDKYFLFGKGLGYFPMAKISAGAKLANSAHCEGIQILFEGGLFLLVVTCGYLANLSKRFFFSKLNIINVCLFCALVSFIGVALGGFPLRIAPLALMGIIIVSGLEYVLTKEIYD